jgi:hypothetical protein
MLFLFTPLSKGGFEILYASSLKIYCSSYSISKTFKKTCACVSQTVQKKN